MKCNGIEFTYRGGDGLGRAVATLLSEMTINFPTEHGSASADLGALIAELDRLQQVEDEKSIRMAKLAEEERQERSMVRYIVERLTNGKWSVVEETPFNVGSEAKAHELMVGAALRFPNNLHRVTPLWMTNEEFEAQEHTQKLKNICDDILRQVVCHCGCYRHHGVSWMPEGSGEGLSVAVDILKKAGL
jgi:hypothetical protein